MNDEQRKQLLQGFKASAAKWDAGTARPFADQACDGALHFMEAHTEEGRQLMARLHKEGENDFAFVLAVLHQQLQDLPTVPSMMMLTEIAAAMMGYGYELGRKEAAA